MSTPARKRLMRDFKRLQQDPPAGISGAPQDNNIMLWNAVIFGYFYTHNRIFMCIHTYIDVIICLSLQILIRVAFFVCS